MLTLMASLLATSLLALSADSLALSGVVVDPAGKPVPDVEVVLAVHIPTDGSVPTLAQTTTDRQGAFRLEIPRQRLKGIGPFPFIWAYRPGQTVAVQRADLTGNGASQPVRLILAEPLRRALTILDPDGRPVAGVRLAAALHDSSAVSFTTPDDRLQRMAVVTGADGVAMLPYLPATINPLTVQVNAPGIAPHNLPLPNRPGSDRFTLKLGRPARLAGSVSYDSGQPAANVSVEVWVENPYYLPGATAKNLKAMGWSSLIRFDSGPVRAQADGSFLTPPQLMTGSSYRIIIRSEGGPVVTSDWLTATAELTTAPPLRLRQHSRLVGLVHDRQAKPVAGARVFLPSGKPSTTTDAQGRFLLEGVLPNKTYLLVKADGFRVQGWPAIPARQPVERTLIVVRTSEPPDRRMTHQADPISVEESRALARRVLEPSLQAALAKGDDNSKWSCLRLASKIDPGRVLELIEKHPFQRPSADASIRNEVAAELLAADPNEAESIVNAVASPELRALAYVRLAEALAAQRDRQRRFLELATVQTRAPAGAGGGVNLPARLAELGRVAEGWLNLGEVEKARPLIREGLELVAALPKTQRYFRGFLSTAARVELDRVLSLIRDLGSARRRSCYVAVALALANEHPAEAERVFQLIDDSSAVPAFEHRNQIVLRLCHRLAKTDPDRARRIIGELKMPQEQACAWALLALGLTGRDKPAACSALAESVQLIDRLLDSAGDEKHAIPQIMVVSNPAASILPIVELVAPERLEEVFWRAVALMPKDDLARQRGVVDARIAAATIFLARYDRQVADVFVTQAMSSQSHTRIVYSPVVIRAKAGVDPRGAVALLEALPPGGLDDPQAPIDMLTNQAREELVICLVEPSEDHWKFVWGGSGVRIDER